MRHSILECSLQLISNLLNSLEQENPNYVFWILDGSMTKQVYHSSSFTKFWGYNPDIIYDMPMLWVNFLEQENLNTYMTQLQERHNNNYLDIEKNKVLYQATHLDGYNNYFKDNCFRCKCPLGREYIVGLSKNINAHQWEHEYQTSRSQWQDDEERVYRAFLKLLYDHFGLMLVQLSTDRAVQTAAHCGNILRQFNCKLTRRELECLHFLCHGDSAKETALRLNISTRTVERHLDNVRAKTNISTKLALVVKFGHYFSKLAKLE